jgi:hypothetical protein
MTTDVQNGFRLLLNKPLKPLFSISFELIDYDGIVSEISSSGVCTCACACVCGDYVDELYSLDSPRTKSVV